MNHYFNTDGLYTHSMPEGGGRIPRNARRMHLPATPWTKVWPRWNSESKRWESVEDHRARSGAHAQEATRYRLPGDAADAPARVMTDVGPLPEGAVAEDATPENALPDQPAQTPDTPAEDDAPAEPAA